MASKLIENEELSQDNVRNDFEEIVEYRKINTDTNNHEIYSIEDEQQNMSSKFINRLRYDQVDQSYDEDYDGNNENTERNDDNEDII